jgi:hypothetical protein
MTVCTYLLSSLKSGRWFGVGFIPVSLCNLFPLSLNCLTCTQKLLFWVTKLGSSFVQSEFDFIQIYKSKHMNNKESIIIYHNKGLSSDILSIM